MAQSFFSSVPQPANDKERRRTKTFSLRSSMTSQRLFLLYIHKLLTDSLDFEAVAHFAIALTCRLFHLCIFLLFISENIQNVKSLPPAGREGEFPPPGPTPCVAPPPKKSSYGPELC